MTHKISTGKYRGRKLVEIGDAPVRPPLDKIKQAIFNIFGDIKERSVLDLFAGSGSLGLEALSRGARFATFVENHPGSLQVLKKNINALGVASQCEILFHSVYSCVDVLTRDYDILLVDPPYSLYDDVSQMTRMTAVLDRLQQKGRLSKDFQGALESPARKCKRLVFQHIEIKDVRKYGQTELLLLS